MGRKKRFKVREHQLYTVLPKIWKQLTHDNQIDGLYREDGPRTMSGSPWMILPRRSRPSVPPPPGAASTPSSSRKTEITFINII